MAESNVPAMVSTWSFGLRGHAAAWPALAAGGASVDAVEASCAAIDADPEVDSVGYGGLPDRSGEVTLEGCIMLGPDQCGAVAALDRHVHPVTVARRVMEHTSHVMLAGHRADDFADRQGIESHELLSAEAKASWKRWCVAPGTVGHKPDDAFHQLRPVDATGDGRLFRSSPETESARGHSHDTVGTLAIDAHGVMAGACSTSGTPFKTPGRVGDSPIIGHGLYVDPKWGGATATGTGELIMGICASFLAVEFMRQGATPMVAARAVIERVDEIYTLRADHQVAMLVMSPAGVFASAALRGGYRTSVTTTGRNEIIEADVVLRSD